MTALPAWLPAQCGKCNKDLEVGGMLPGSVYPPDWDDITGAGEWATWTTDCAHCKHRLVVSDPSMPVSAKGAGPVHSTPYSIGMRVPTHSIKSDTNTFLKQCGDAVAAQTTIRVAMASGAIAEDFFVLRFDKHVASHGLAHGDTYQIHLRSADGRYEMEMSVQS